MDLTVVLYLNILHNCLVICLLSYSFFVNCVISFITSFELLLAYILDKRIGKSLIVKPLPDDFLRVNNIFF